MSKHTREQEAKKPDGNLMRFMYVASQLSCTEIASMYGVTRQTVSLWLKDYGIEVRKRGRPDDKGGSGHE